jgi:sigma-B regulation protein RsbU (phosphoserine phosphatase)
MNGVNGMERAPDRELERRIESLTVNLLECYEELDLIYRLSRGLMATLDAQRSAELVLSEAMEIFEADVGWMLPGPAAPAFAELRLGVTADALERLRAAALGDLLARGKSRIFHSLREELDLDGEGLPAALLCAAVKTESAVHGVLCVGRRGPGRQFTARDLKLADALAAQAAIAIENSVLHRTRLEEQQALIRMEEELRLAFEIQSNLLPRSAPSVPGYDIACRGIPARQVGGDYYDFIPIDDDRLGLCLADVCGHGMPAALLMANLQATVRGQALAAASPAECMRRSNRLLYRSTDAGRFATCFYGVLELPTGRLSYCNAGHDYPLVFAARGAEAALDRGGLMLGVYEEPGYEESALSLASGDLLVLYSDGITERFDSAERDFGVGGLKAAVAGARGGSAAQILEAVLAAAAAHAPGGPHADDMTLVVVRRL